jgi:hypothetical protein
MKSLRIYLIVAGLLLTIYIVAQVNRPKAVDWTVTLSSKEKTPYGAYVLYNRLGDIFPKASIIPYRQPVYNVIAEDSIKQSSYIIVCAGMDLSKSDYKQLINYIKKGNDVFIAAQHFGTLLSKDLKIKSQFDTGNKDDKSSVHFTNPSLNPRRNYIIDKYAGNSSFTEFDTLKAVVLGENANHHANFLKYSFGKGSLYLSVNPKLFSNYSLLNPQGAEYAATSLSYVKTTPRIIWDEYYTQGNAGADTPMRLFLSNPTLQWAYNITIFTLLAFVLYEIKRRQRIIPVIEPLSNLTLDFVTTVGQVYYEQHNNANIAQKKILYFLTYLRDEHQIKTTKLDKEFVEKLIGKLGMDAGFASEMVTYFNYINLQEHVNDNELIKLNKFIEQFYMQAR